MTSTVNMSHNTTKKPRNINQMAAYIVLIGLAAAGAWSVNSIGINIPTLLQSADNAVNFVSHMFPLDFPPIGELTAMIVETLAIVFLATALAVVLSVPVSLWAARRSEEHTSELQSRFDLV